MAGEWFEETHDRVGKAEENANPDWRALAYDTVVEVAKLLPEFTSDDVMDSLFEKMDEKKITTHNFKALGPVMIQVAKTGMIEQTGEFRSSSRPVAHNCPKRVWASTIYHGPEVL